MRFLPLLCLTSVLVAAPGDTPAEVTAISTRVRALVAAHSDPVPLVSEELPITPAEFEALVLSDGAPLSLAVFHQNNGEVVEMVESPWDGQEPLPGSRSLRFRKKVTVCLIV